MNKFKKILYSIEDIPFIKEYVITQIMAIVFVIAFKVFSATEISWGHAVQVLLVPLWIFGGALLLIFLMAVVGILWEKYGEEIKHLF